MSILSIKFVGFVLLTVIIYYVIPLKFRWLVLLASSCVFYALAGWQGCIWLAAVTLFTYAASLWQGKMIRLEKAAYDENPEKSKQIARLRKLLLAAALILPFAAMAITKYYELFKSWIAGLTMENLLIPLGLSYFTFQAAGYMIDVYREKVEPEKNPLKYLLFVAFFPQMTQGPISTYKQLQPQLLEGHRFDPQNFVMGAQLSLWGFLKKLVIADRLAAVTVSLDNENPGWLILFSAIIFIIRLYADFSGGIDIIRGAALMMGINLPENFRRPFFSHSVSEYWRRWHITLGAWFKNYLFYPFTTSGIGLRLSKIGRKIFGKKAGRGLPAAVSTAIVFFIIGIWHTANMNAVIYGLYFGLEMGIAVMLEPAFRKIRKNLKINEKSLIWNIFTMVRTWLLILIPQYFAFSESPKIGMTLLTDTFKNWTFKGAGTLLTGYMTEIQWLIAAFAVMIMLTVDIICEKHDLNKELAETSIAIRWPVLAFMILSIVIFGCYGAGYDAAGFFYTNF